MTRNPTFASFLLTALLVVLPSCKTLTLTENYTLDTDIAGADGDTDTDIDTDADTDSDTDADGDTDTVAVGESRVHSCTTAGDCVSEICLPDGYCAVFCESSEECGTASNGFPAYCAPEAVTGRNACFPGCETGSDCDSYADGVGCTPYAEMGDYFSPRNMCFVPE